MRENYGFSFNDGDTITALRNGKNPKKAIQGSPWYQILSNPKYSNQFNYIGSFVGERYKLIEDGTIDQEEDGKTVYSEQTMRTRGEQSDLIMVLLNLAYIPDDVVKQLEDFNHGWSFKFKKLMDEYYSQERFSKWNDQFDSIRAEVESEMPNANEDEKKAAFYGRLNEKLEESYHEFVEEAREKDLLYHSSMEEYEAEKKRIVQSALEK